MVLVAAFTLRALKKTFFGDERSAHGARETVMTTERATTAEKIGATFLMTATLIVGLYPKLLLDRIMPAVETMRFLQR
jgi:NADH:ubiquinone oxidoreductase subunit 4 (subunit M)